MNYFRIILVIAIIALLVVGYHWIKDKRAAWREQELFKYAEVITEIGIAAEYNRGSNQDFLAARDSILEAYNLTSDSMAIFRTRMEGKQAEWLRVWELVDSLTSVRVGQEMNELRQNKDHMME
nr:hypothetical protein [candidate division Zixibacteria bacterium]